MNKEEKLKLFEELLKKHDWYFDKSDDPRIWDKGNRESFEINKLRVELGKDAEWLYERYCPFSNKVH